MTKLSIVMACHQDFNGVYFSVNALRMYHKQVMPDCEIIVVDNSPDSPEGTTTRDFIQGGIPLNTPTEMSVRHFVQWLVNDTPETFNNLFEVHVESKSISEFKSRLLSPMGESVQKAIQSLKSTGNPGELIALARGHEVSWFSDFLRRAKGEVEKVVYIPYGGIGGTAAPRDYAIRAASGKYVLCMDSHVLLWPDALKKLMDFYEREDDNGGLLSGPMMYDNFDSMSTHFDDDWRGEMWGTWGTDQRGDGLNGPAFEIPAQGLGVFSCRKDSWLGFNPNFRGFGGEEFYIHTKYRKAVKKCYCLPFLRWVHRFGRPQGVKYNLNLWDKVRNYIIGHHELDLPFDRIHQHFVATGLLPQADWDSLLSNPENPPLQSIAVRTVVNQQAVAHQGHPEFKATPPCSTCGDIPAEVTLEMLYEKAVNTPSDINEHSGVLKELASRCGHVTEFGMRSGVSTVALLAGQPNKFVTYTPKDKVIEALKSRAGKTEFVHKDGNSLNGDIEQTDMVFLDTVHTAQHFYNELIHLAPKVNRYIVRHDTQIFGERGDNGSPGLLAGLREFLKVNREWTVVDHYENNHGLVVISKDSRDKKPLPGRIEMAVNFTKALASHVAGGSQMTTQEQLQRRLEVCTVCPKRNGDSCGVCGCLIDKKATWSEQPCPIGRWGEIGV